MNIKKQLRKIEKTDTACFICGNHSKISHAHHVLPVAEYEKTIAKHNLFDICIPNPIVYLCPNHHYYIHRIGKLDIIQELSLDELEKYDEIQEIAKLAVKKIFEIAKTRAVCS